MNLLIKRILIGTLSLIAAFATASSNRILSDDQSQQTNKLDQQSQTIQAPPDTKLSQRDQANFNEKTDANRSMWKNESNKADKSPNDRY